MKTVRQALDSLSWAVREAREYFHSRYPGDSLGRRVVMREVRALCRGGGNRHEDDPAFPEYAESMKHLITIEVARRELDEAMEGAISGILEEEPATV